MSAVEAQVTTEARVRKLIADQFGISESDVQPEKHLFDDLGADSLDAVELTMALEDEFNIEIPDEAADKMSTVKSVVDYIEGRIAK